MKIWCTQDEKKRIIKILAQEDSLCIFDKFICLADDCNACLKNNIKWIIKGGNKFERPEDKRTNDYERRGN